MDNDFSDFDEAYWSLGLSHDLSAWLKDMLNVSVDSSVIYELLGDTTFVKEVWESICVREG